MKKRMTLLLTLVITVVMSSFCFADESFAAGNDAKYMGLDLKPAMKSIKLKWKKRSGIKYYVLCKKDVTKIIAKDPDAKVKLSQYKKLKRINAAKKKKYAFTDKKVKKNHYYAYVIKAYKIKGGKKTLAYTNYEGVIDEYRCPGLDRPEILNDGDGENHSNTLRKVYLYISSYYGVDPQGAVIYRKAEGETKYKKIKAKKSEKNTFTSYVDTTVKAGKTYYYKAKVYKKIRGKKYYSKKSKAFMIQDANTEGLYSIQSMTPAGEVKEFVIRLSSKASNCNADLLFEKGAEAEYNSSSSQTYRIVLAGYSHDNKSWSDIPEKGLILGGKDTIYLKFRAKDDEVMKYDADTAESKVYADPDVSGSNLIKYRTNGYFKDSVFELDIQGGSGYAHKLYD